MFEVLITSSVLIPALALLRRLWKGRISPVLQYAFWSILAVRLLVPVPVSGNALSVMNVADRVISEAEKRAEVRREESLQSGSEQEADILPGEDAGIKKSAAFLLEESQDDFAGAEGRLGDSGESAQGSRRSSGTGPGSLHQEKPGEGGTDVQRPDKPWVSPFLLKLAQYIWLAGIVFLAAVVIAGNIRFRRRLHRERRLLCRRDGIGVYVVEFLDSPCLYGILRPSVYLNPACLMSECRREHAIAHELAHYRHGDHIWILVRTLCTVLYWFDPLVWLAARLCARDCEMACDAGAIRRLGEGQREAYGRTLIELTCNSAGGLHLLRCSTDLFCGKEELKERITMIAAEKKKKGVAVVCAAFCAACLAACTFGGAREETGGGYIEEAFEGKLTVSKRSFLVQDGEKVRLVSFAPEAGNEWLSEDGGESFAKEAAVGTGNVWADEFAAAPDGARILAQMEQNGEGWQYIWHLVSGDGTKTGLTPTEGSEGVRFFYGSGYFYAINEYQGRYTVYQVEPAGGRMKSLMELSSPAYYLAAGEDMLCILQAEGAMLYDLVKGDIADKQDAALSDYLLPMTDNFRQELNGTIECQSCFYLKGDWVYILNRDRLVRHELYGDSFEQVIDGNMCGIGDSGHYFCGMAVGGEAGEEEFLILFSDGKLLRYRYDPEAAQDGEILRVYTAYENTDVRRLVAAFREEYPEIQIRYEVGVDPRYGVTYEDALRSLATELAAGTGPDILVMDELPCLSYAEKGALLDLSDFREEMTEDTYFTRIIDDMKMDGSLYAIPLSFVIPIWGGQAELFQDAGEVEGLEEWVNLLEQVTAQEPEGGGLGITNVQSLFSLLSMTSMGEWVSGGSLNREAVEAFLVQAKRICDIQAAVLEDGYWGGAVETESDKENWVTRQVGSGLDALTAVDIGFILFPEQTFWAGFMSDNYTYLNAYMKYGEYEFRQMPGQSFGKCLPVSMMALNSGSRYTETSLLFLEYALSEKYQRSADLYGFPINREAYGKRQINQYTGGSYETVGVGSYHGERETVDVRWPNEEAFGKLNALTDSIRGVNLCEYQVYRVIAEEAVRALNDECGIGEALDAIEQKLSIYMAE